MRMSVSNLEAIRDWAIRNQAAIPDLTLRLTFATDLARSVIEQEAAPDPQRVIEIGYDIGNLMWRIRSSCSRMTPPGKDKRGGGPAAGTRVILEAIRRGHVGTAEISGFVNSHAGRSVEVVEVIGHDESLDMPEFGYREIAVERDCDVYLFTDSSDAPCRSSRISNLPSSISKARRLS
jgi:hypothetical protein